jgi:ABC-type nitrate/sulfonate/bicarbonate transport system permease component
MKISKSAKSVFFLSIAFQGLWTAFLIFPSFARAESDSLWPSFSQLAKTGQELLFSSEFHRDLWMTCWRFLAGFSIGAALAMVFLFLCCLSKGLRMVLEFIVYLSYPLPRFVLLPFFIFTFGLGWGSQVAFISMGSFFPIIINAVDGLEHINKNFLDVARHYGAKGWRYWTRVVLPGISPYLFTGIRLSAGVTFLYVILIEFMTSTNGVGAMVWLSLQSLRLDKLLMGTFFIAVLNAFILFFIKFLERLIIPWSGKE